MSDCTKAKHPNPDGVARTKKHKAVHIRRHNAFVLRRQAHALAVRMTASENIYPLR